MSLPEPISIVEAGPVPGSPVAELETPCIVVDRERMLANLRQVQAIADRHGLRVRPHVKTHKSPEIARLQVELGAVGVTAAKPDEARVFIEAGFTSVTVAFPVIDPRKLDRLLTTARAHGAELRLLADSPALVERLADAAARAGMRIGVFLKVDVGLGRVGVDPEGPEALEVARAIRARDALEFRGLLAHAGHAYAAPGPEAIAAVAEAERRTLLGLADRLRRDGIPVPEISVGSTPTVLATASFDGITEIRPGNYVFRDLTAVRLGVTSLAEVALTVRATVVSRNDRHAIIDAGSKVLSTDLGPHGTGGTVGYGRAFLPDRIEGEGLVVERLSEEHGFVRLDGARLDIGQPLVIAPNHACVVTNLVGRVALVADGRVDRRLDLPARGSVL